MNTGGGLDVVVPIDWVAERIVVVRTVMLHRRM